MVIKVGINGFGRVGRVVFRTCLQHPEVEVCAINDPAVEVDYICYLIKYDSTHGTLKNNITHTDNEIIVDDLHVKVFQEKYPTGIPWHTAGAQYVVEASGLFTTLNKASGHLICDGVKRVIVTAPCIDVPMVIFGVNETKIKTDAKVISCGSSTLYCLAPIIKVLEDNYGLEEGFITSIHAMTPSLKPLDGLCLKGKHWRDHRSITQNIIPAATGACKALGRIIPAVRDRMCGLAFRVPIANVSVLDITVRLKKFTSLDNIVSDIEKFNKKNKNIMKSNSDQAVSSDFIGDSHSCILDINSSIQLKPNFFKLICWYENEYSYACRVIDLITFSDKQLDKSEHETKIHNIPSKIKDVTPQKLSGHLEKKNKIKPTVVAALVNKETKCPSSSRRSGPSPVISFNHDPDEKVMICKIWNDETPAVRQKPTSFFHAYSALAPRTQQIKNSDYQSAEKRLESVKQETISNKAQERLEKVKHEFSKMVNVTETLLKKSYNSKINLQTSESNNEAGKGSYSVNTNIKIIKTADNSIEYSSNCDISCSMVSSSTLNSKNVIVCKTNIEQAENTMRDKNNSDCSLSATESVIEAKPAVISIHNPNVSKSFVAKTFTEIFNGLSNLQLQFSVIKTNNAKYERKGESTGNDCDNLNYAVDQNANEEQHKNLTHIDANEKNNILSPQNEHKPDVDNIDENNIEKLEPAPNTPETEACQEECNDTEMKDVKDEQHITVQRLDVRDDLHIKDNQGDLANPHFSKHVRTAASDGNKADVQTEGASSADVLVCVPISTSVARGSIWNSSQCYAEKQDIYDKLDSASGSDNSFEVEKKASEVINITDLTSSLEDLDRLDKICRIMEISDELSDKLFSALNKGSVESNINLAKKRWSFKDLCEKVNLDEFCTKVFGK